MRLIVLLPIVFFVFSGLSAKAQLADLVEGSWEVLDTASVVTSEFNFSKMTLNRYMNQESFLRAQRGNPSITREFLFARDSLCAQAFLNGFQSQLAAKTPLIARDTTSTKLHLIVKTVHLNFDEKELEAPLSLELEYILLYGASRRIQLARYYQKNIRVEPQSNLAASMAQAYQQAGHQLAQRLNQQP